MYIKFILVVIFLSLISCLSASTSQTGQVIIRSLPLECEVLFGQNIKNVEGMTTVKGGAASSHSSFMLSIQKVEEMVIIEGVPAGKHPVSFKRGNDILESEVDIQPGKMSLVKGDFGKRKVLITPQVFTASDGSPMVLIAEGEFMMGSDKGELDEQPIHKVYVDAFYMDVYEVTNAQYKKFMKATGHKAPRFWDDPKSNAPDQPVVGVTWQDAVDYCKWAGKRLPTEAEWEKAARGGLVGKEYPWGDDENTGDNENPGGNENPGLSGAAPVGSFAPNGYGLHDMERNAWEWCADWYDEEYYSKSPDRNPKGSASSDKKTLRGGSWFAGVFTPLRIAYRYGYDPSQTSNMIGFRCVSRETKP